LIDCFIMLVAGHVLFSSKFTICLFWWHTMLLSCTSPIHRCDVITA